MTHSFWQQVRNRSYLGWQQLSRNPIRLLIAVTGVTIADVLMFIQMGVQGALIDANTRIHTNLNADIVVIHEFARDLLLLPTISRRQLTQLQDVAGVTDFNTLYVSRIGWQHPETRRPTEMMLIGQNPLNPGVSIVDDSTALALLQRPNTLFLDEDARGSYGSIRDSINLGQSVTTEISQNTVTIAATFRLGAAFSTDGTLLGSQETFLRLNPNLSAGEVNLGLFTVAEAYDVDTVLAAIRAQLPEGMQVLTQAEFIDLEKSYLNTVSPVGIIFGFGTLIAIVVGAVFVFQILSDDVNEHMADYATLKAIGYRDRFLLGIILEESMILAVLGFLPATGLALFYYHILTLATSIPVVMTNGRIIWVFFLTIALCCGSGLVATRRLRTADPAEIF